jgi:hypothetical protein
MAPTVFTTDRLLEFTSVNELSKLIGYTPTLWPAVAVKELIDNALDSCEDEKLAPAIAVYISTTDRTITVIDNGFPESRFPRSSPWATGDGTTPFKGAAMPSPLKAWRHGRATARRCHALWPGAAWPRPQIHQAPCDVA